MVVTEETKETTPRPTPERAARVQGQRLRTQGGSMLPFIPSGSWLELRPYAGERLHVGDLVVFPSASGMVAHRIVGMRGAPPHQVLSVRGDAQTTCETLDAAAVAYVVEAVDTGRLRFRADGALGRVSAALAVHGGPVLPWLAQTARRLARLRDFTRG